jgi:hypothetical protein
LGLWQARQVVDVKCIGLISVVLSNLSYGTRISET